MAAVVAVGGLVAACSSGSSGGRAADNPVVSPGPTSIAPPTSAPPTSAAASPARRPATQAPRPAPAKKHAAEKAAPTSTAPARPRPAALPLRFGTGDARQVITVTAASTSSTEGSLQAWRRVAGGWRKVGRAVHAWLGSEGSTRHPSETRSATPIGSFTLTRAFGHDADPGTALPYTRTTPSDWWISESGPLYNTMQRCASGCAFSQGDPNEHLYYETPYYDYAVVIDYNTRNAPGGVVQGAGSAFFLHVTVGEPTAGCVSIDQAQLIRLLRWLSPGQHPRILIGTVGG